MKRFLMLAGAAFGLLPILRADNVLLWMLDDPVIESWGGSSFSVWEPVLGPDGEYYSLNAARVVAKDEDGLLTYLSIYDTASGTFDPTVTGVALNEAPPAVLPVWAGVIPDSVNAANWSFAIELGVFEESGLWTVVASSDYETFEKLKEHIAVNVDDMPGYLPWSPNAFNAPEPSSGLLVLIGGALLALRRRRRVVVTAKGRAVLAAGLLAAGGLSAAPVVSSNIHGFVRIDPVTTNTLVSVPWTGYTPDGQETKALLANRLVSPIGLTAGDLLMQPTNEIAYAVWSVVVDAQGGRSWQPVMSASRATDNFGRTRNAILEHTGTGTVDRGRGVWVIRQNPLKEDGTPNPIYLSGQWTNNGRVVEIPGVVLGKTLSFGGYDTCTYTMLANPDCSKETVINDIPWDPQLVGEQDTLVISNDRAGAQVLFWEDPSEAAPYGRWYYTQTVKTGFLIKTVKAYDAAVPAGVGFWYVRRSTAPIYVTWPGEGDAKRKAPAVDPGEER